MNAIQAGVVASSLLLLCSPANSAGEFEQWKHQQQQAFQQYKDERDREFTEFLQEHWRAIDLQQGFVRDQKPKPVVMPVAKPRPEKPEPVTQPVEEKPAAAIVPDASLITPEPSEPLMPVTVPRQRQKGLRTQVDYFGTVITFYFDPAFKQSLPYRVNESVLSHFWSGLSKTDYEPLLEQLRAQSEALQLDDWGYALLVNSLSESIYPASDNRQALFAWFMLTKAGYRSRVAYDDRRVYLLLASVQQMYEVTYFTFDGERYYAVSFDGSRYKPGRVYTYDGHYPGAVKKLDMRIVTRAAKAGEPQKRDLSFEYQGQRYHIEASYEQARIDYLNTYPQLDLELYFTSTVGEVAESPLLQQLAVHIESMSELDAVNFLLGFVQNSFGYRTDGQQFGEENYLFPEETIYYPYSDCEDRSVLFAWLVRRLLGLEVIGLNYPGHVAAAVHFKDDVEGDHVVYKGTRYAVADPTYINARVGMTMSEHRHVEPDVVPVR